MPFVRGQRPAGAAPEFFDVRLGDWVAFEAGIRLRATAIRRKKWRADNPAASRAIHKRWRDKNHGLRRAQQRVWYRSNHDLARATNRRSRLKTAYGITPEQYEILFAQQNGACAICHREPTKTRLNVDHCHADGRIRGLLCHRCNRGLGFFSTRDALERAVAYWDRSVGLYVPKK